MGRLTVKDSKYLCYGLRELVDNKIDHCDEYCANVTACLDCAIYKSIEKLGKYEDLEEEGRLVKLPCKVGDIVYFPFYSKDRDTGATKKGIIATNVKSIKIDGKVTIDYFTDTRSIGDQKTIGIDVFLTLEEANKKLQEIIRQWEG